MARGGVVMNAHEVLTRMHHRSQRMETALQEAARQAARDLFRESKETLQQEIYNVPIPQGPGGKPKWRRTGRLLRAEMSRADGTAIVLRNATKYALYRHRLGTPRGRKIVSPGVRSVQWHDQVADRKREHVRALRRRAVLRVLREG